jgi:purine-binding chemotaxis protein CheW
VGVHDDVPVSPLPGLAPPVMGLGTVLGRAVTIIDLEPLLSPSPRSRTDPDGARPTLLLLAEPFLGLGLWVVSEIAVMPSGSPAPPPEGPVGRLAVRGAREEGGGVVAILELERLLRELAAGRGPTPTES